jgi:hypothetical protein
MGRDDAEPKNDEDRPFTPAERKAIRKMLVQEERAKWLWSTLRIWAGYLVGAISVLYAAKDHIKNALKGAFQ